MKLFISEPEERHQGAILIHDEALNDIAEFYHNELHTVDQSYETALMLAKALVAAASQEEQACAEADMLLAIKAWLKCPPEKRPSPYALGKQIEDIAVATTTQPAVDCNCTAEEWRNCPACS